MHLKAPVDLLRHLLGGLLLLLISVSISASQNSGAELAAKVVQGAQQTWLHEVHQRPEVLQSIFYRRARKNQPFLRAEVTDSRVHLRIVVLDLLGFV